MKLFRQIILILVAAILLSSHFADARRVRSITSEASRTDFICVIYEEVRLLGYEAKTAESITKSLIEIFPSLESLKGISDLKERISALAKTIKGKISYKHDIFELSEIVEGHKANCLGYAQIFYVLGRAIDLHGGMLAVYRSDIFGQVDHTANSIVLNDSEYIILDLSTLEEDAYMSPVFNWDEHYMRIGESWFLREGIIDIIDDRYRAVRVLYGIHKGVHIHILTFRFKFD